MKRYLLIPVENQVREMDAKLLVALLAARRGFTAVIGWKQALDARIGRFPPSIYIAKSMTQRNTLMLRIKRQLGHYVLAWDEEAVVHYPQEIYFARRIGADALPLVDHIAAWGEDNRGLLLAHPAGDGQRISVLGNPRVDLLRQEMSPLFEDRVARLRAEHGDYILVNTNFGSINGYMDRLNLMRQDPESGEWVPGGGSRGMPRDYAEGLFAHRRHVFGRFQELLPRLAAAFPDRTLILRPHPAEDHQFWHDHLASHANVKVLAEGNVVPWLKAATCLIHNGCTTAVEGFLLGTPIVSFVPRPSERFDFHLPNKLGRVAGDAAGVIAAVNDPRPSEAFVAERNALLDQFIHRTERELAAERIVAHLTPLRETLGGRGGSWLGRAVGRARAEARRMVKERKRRRGEERYSEAFMRQRFPELTVNEVQDRVRRLADIVDHGGSGGGEVRVRERAPELFEVAGA